MENILKTIKENNLISKGDIIGVAVSGGSDSMCLLHYLHSLSSEMDIEIVVIHIDHGIRSNSSEDARFVLNFCKKRMIRSYKFKIDVPKLILQKKMSLEQAAREARYGVFDALIKKGVADKIAIAHNSRDQAETILINLFRGTGVVGVSGMDVIRGAYIRPMLNTSKKSIFEYISNNDIPFVEDETNKDNSYSRNHIRNLILPLVEEKWPDAVDKIVNFGRDCYEDNAYISGQIITDAIIYENKTAKIPLTYFLYPNAIVSRIIFKALGKIDVNKDIDRVHIQMIKNLAQHGENGKKINLPLKISVYKEYDYVTITNRQKDEVDLKVPFKSGSFDVENFGTVTIRRVKDFLNDTLGEGELLVDTKKIPKTAEWRFKQNGDVFHKFGSGTKKLKDYFIDKKIPSRLRNTIPVLANENEVLIIAGIEISENVKVDQNTKTASKITVIK
ncbi:MAG: tRNA lysidine(34) synthetase TilS [Clostridia bacterium]|nr:tRNA lysidine(34) synthetase TilS [Clostridia bacterium]